jgi:hypothetical protein
MRSSPRRVSPASLVSIAAALAVAAFTGVAGADAPLAAGTGGGSAAERAPGRVTLPTVVVEGRAPLPLVVVDLRQPTAAHEASAAHEALRERWLRASIPATLRGGGF